MKQWLEGVWYGQRRGGWVLIPLSWLFRIITALRRWVYRLGIAGVYRAEVPVMVIGNITVGGSGKTPMVGWLAVQARQQGFHPAIISRGYGGDQPNTPVLVTEESSAQQVGDEPLMLFRQTALPIYVCRRRSEAAKAAIAAGATLIIADDGLQHYALHRDFEVVVVDANREHGNGRCLPAGPLREPPSRLDTVDLVLYRNGESPQIGYSLIAKTATNASSGESRLLTSFGGQSVRAVAGIGYPEGFFRLLERAGMTVERVAPGDHAKADDAVIYDPEIDVFMTEKDAVKYHALGQQHWIVSAEVSLLPGTRDALLALLKRSSENSPS
ncbi:MAG: tetraacyldisaccharide 4'-kinase [Pseudomonadota bacterium]